MSETKSVLSGIVHFNLFDDIAFYIDKMRYLVNTKILQV